MHTFGIIENIEHISRNIKFIFENIKHILLEYKAYF